MHPRPTSLIVSCVIAFAASTSWAAEISGSIQILPEPTWAELGAGSPVVTATCAVGETRTPNVPAGFGAATFYTLLNPADCSACSGGVLVLRTANFMVRTAGGACTFPVEVSIVYPKAGSACLLEPDPSALACGPVVTDITSTSIAIFTASVSLPDNCCISRPAFLRIKALDLGTCGTLAWGVVTAGCVSCRSFVEVPPMPLGEACFDWASNTVQWADADCCDPTPTPHGSWGRLKVLYR